MMSSSSSYPVTARRSRICSSQNSSVVCWSQLPYDLIVLTANKLLAIEDFLAFSAVCRSWRYVYLNKDWTPISRVPWLMVFETYNGELTLRSFFDLCKNKVYKLPLREAQGRQCWGSSCGWVFTVSHNLVISLLNPVTRVCLELPSHYTLGSQDDSHLTWFNFILNATVCKTRDGFLAMAICRSYSLAFARPGDSAWTRVETSKPISFINVVFFEDHVLALSIVGTLVLVVMNGSDPPRAIYMALPPKDEKGWQQIHLVESSGDLLMVFHYDCKGRKWFKVYKFDFSAKEWIQLESLGGCVLFVDGSHSISVPASDDFKPNSIYFVNDNIGWFWACKQGYEWQYCGAYHMDSEATDNFSLLLPLLGEDSPGYTCPVWLMPTI